MEPFVKDALGMVGLVVKVFPKKELLEMETTADNPDFRTVHRIHKERWMEGLRGSLSIFFLAVWHIITADVLSLAGKSKGLEWEMI